jgi:hypothetical protein
MKPRMEAKRTCGEAVPGFRWRSNPGYAAELEEGGGIGPAHGRRL